MNTTEPAPHHIALSLLMTLAELAGMELTELQAESMIASASSAQHGSYHLTYNPQFSWASPYLPRPRTAERSAVLSIYRESNDQALLLLQGDFPIGIIAPNGPDQDLMWDGQQLRPEPLTDARQLLGDHLETLLRGSRPTSGM